MEVVQPTTAAQIFHVLRRQMLPDAEKTPDRHDAEIVAASQGCRVTTGRAGERIVFASAGEVDKTLDMEKVKRVLVCTGRVYYDLAHRRAELGRQDVAIVRAGTDVSVPA